MGGGSRLACEYNCRFVSAENDKPDQPSADCLEVHTILAENDNLDFFY